MGAVSESGFGGIEVIDTEALQSVDFIETHSRVHNAYVTPDGRYLVGSTFGGEANMPVYDLETGELAWSLYPPRNDSVMEGVRPIAFETNADGSTRRAFVQISNFHGFTVVDWETHEEVARVELPEIPEAERDPGPFNDAPAHGIGVAPDQQTLWVCSRLNHRVYAYALPTLDYLGEVLVGSHPDWLTFTPDSRFAYVANGGGDDVSVIDIASRTEVARIAVGSAPKRNITAILP
jgi:YVTN family beta-propeller protein